MKFTGSKEQIIKAICNEANRECLDPRDFFEFLDENQKNYLISNLDFVKVISENPYGAVFCGSQTWRCRNEMTHTEVAAIQERNEYINNIWNTACKIMKACVDDSDNPIEYGLQHDWFPSWEQLEQYISANYVKVMSDNVYMALVVGDCEYIPTSNYQTYEDVKKAKKREHYKKSVMNKLPKTPEKQREFLDYFHEDLEYMRVVTWEDLEERLNTWYEVKNKQKIHFLLEEINRDVKYYEDEEINYDDRFADSDINDSFLYRVKALIEYAEEFNGEKE